MHLLEAAGFLVLTITLMVVVSMSTRALARRAGLEPLAALGHVVALRKVSVEVAKERCTLVA